MVQNIVSYKLLLLTVKSRNILRHQATNHVGKSKILVQWDPLIRSSLIVNPAYKKAKKLVPSKVFFIMTYESSDLRISLIRNPPYKNVNFWSHRGRQLGYKKV